MKRLRVMAVLAATAAASGAISLAGTGSALAAMSGTGVVAALGGTWGKAIEVPGSAALNVGGIAQVISVSCPSAGNCAAGGTYRGGAEDPQAFVVSERNGRWGGAISLTEDLVSSVSCPSAGDCTAAGSLFVDSERNGRWGKPVEMPGLSALDKGHFTEVRSVSCAAAGSCSAGGYYRDRSRHFQAFVDSERNGRWGTAIEVPGSAALNVGGNAQVNSVSCTSAGRCAAVGFYQAQRRCCVASPFVLSERNGQWGKAIELHGSGALNANGPGEVNSLSCSTAGNCAAGGLYTSSHPIQRGQAFVVSQH